MNKSIAHALFALLALAGLAACTVPEPAPAPAAEPETPIATDEQAVPETGPMAREEVLRTMRIADILYAAREAFENNRLLLPPDDNAFDRYLRVLSMDPGNEVAQQGIDNIVERYVQLADQSIRLGQYDEAARLLDRAASIGRQRDMVARARERLAQARENPVEFIALDREALSRQGPQVKDRLEEISQRLGREEGATFLIIARNDAEGRWIYRVMREAAGGRRLRGNIEVGDRPGVLIRYPSS